MFSCLRKIIFSVHGKISELDASLKSNFHYVEMAIMTSQILKFVDFTKTQKSRYLENETLFFIQIKKFMN